MALSRQGSGSSARGLEERKRTSIPQCGGAHPRRLGSETKACLQDATLKVKGPTIGKG